MKIIKKFVDLSYHGLIALPDLSDVKVTSGFSCDDNKLTSLKGCPREVSGNFFCRSNKLLTLEGCPEYVGHDFFCWNNPGNFTKEDVRKVCKVRGDIFAA